ncbi:hypothetical protein NQD34_005776, partial [Periophthalmus magnuspinnatus]
MWKCQKSLTKEGWLEEGFWATEPLIADGDDLSVGQLVALLQRRGGGCSVHLLLEVQGNVAQLLLDVTNNFPLGCGGERVATLCQDLHEVVCEVAAGQVQTQDGVGQSIALVDGHCVGHTITGVHDNTGGTTRGIQGQHSLDGNVHGGGVEGVMPDLLHVIPVGHNTVFNGVLQGQDTPLALSFVTNVAVFLAHTNHHS